MENVLVYRVRFEAAAPVIAEADRQRATAQEANSAALAPVQTPAAE